MNAAYINAIFVKRGPKAAAETAEAAGRHDLAGKIKSGKWVPNEAAVDDIVHRDVARQGDKILRLVTKGDTGWYRYVVINMGESGKVVSSNILGKMSEGKALQAAGMSFGGQPPNKKETARKKRQARIERDRENRRRQKDGGRTTK